ncbi:uncharacterized protein LOC120218382 [Hibiscus syriacus]|uniref:uncharacterized protein LOC120218382 n=1 Tax=Hibiscus syriacus TaxID=106335 RepID=UPI00192192A3|nr:uncharacterized protein LOC120218382 [Hibiscus syriacus]
MSGDTATNWRELFAAGIDQELKIFSPAVIEGSCVVKPSKDVFEEGILEWKFALVGQFIGSALAFGSIQRVVSMLWGKASPIKWEPNLKELQFDLSRMPIWIHLYNVPLELFSRRGLSYIASAVGRPLHMDSVTAAREKLEYTRVCIEITDGSSIRDRVDVILNDESVASIRVSVPWMPSSCTDCGRFGHFVKLCPRGKKSEQVWRAKGPVNDAQLNVPSTSGKTSDDVNINIIASEGLSSGKGNNHAINDILPSTQVGAIGCLATVNPELGGDCSATLELVNQIDTVTDASKVSEKGIGYNVFTIQADPLNNPLVKRGRGRPAKEGKITGGASKKKFNVLNSLDPDNVLEIPTVDSGRKQRGASMGVAKLVQELKMKKKEHVDNVKKLEARGAPSFFTSASSILSSKFGDWRYCCNYDFAENGRIWVLWRNDVVCSIISSFDQSITIKGCFKDIEFFLTTVYGSNDGSIRKHLWTQLCSVEASVGDRAWLIGGNFNVILNVEESSSQINAGTLADMVNFQSCVVDLGLTDHPYTGPLFTWSNKQQATYLARKLDRVLVNSNWFEIFSASDVEFQAPGDSDHFPILVWLYKEVPAAKPKPFKFFNFWAMHPDFMSLVKDSWQDLVNANPAQTLFLKLKRLKMHLKEPNRNSFNDLSGQVREKRDKLKTLQLANLTPAAAG